MAPFILPSFVPRVDVLSTHLRYETVDRRNDRRATPTTALFHAVVCLPRSRRFCELGQSPGIREKPLVARYNTLVVT